MRNYTLRNVPTAWRYFVMVFFKNKTVKDLSHAGTGKTVIAAFDYRNFRKKHPGELCRLFIFLITDIYLATWDRMKIFITESNDFLNPACRIVHKGQ